MHTFGVSGKLIMNVLVMYDHQTESLWSQFLGMGVKGPLTGAELDVVPVTHTTWEAWRELHPDTLVVDKKGRYQSDGYRFYYDDGTAGVLGEAHLDDRLDGKELVLGVDVDGTAKAYPFSVLMDQPIVNDSFAGRDVLVFFEETTGTALFFDRKVDGRPLTFHMEGEASGAQTILIDNETGSRWLAFTGRAVAGELKGKSLARGLSHLSFWFAWTDWNPDTELYVGLVDPPPEG